MSSFSGGDPASRAWHREQMGISNDISGLRRDAHVEAMAAALDALNLSDEDRITVITAYFKALARSQAETAEGVRSGEPAKPLSPATLDWMRRIQEGGVRMATDESYRKTIGARLF